VALPPAPRLGGRGGGLWLLLEPWAPFRPWATGSGSVALDAGPRTSAAQLAAKNSHPILIWPRTSERVGIEIGCGFSGPRGPKNPHQIPIPTLPKTRGPIRVRCGFVGALQDLSLSPVSGLGPGTVDFGGLHDLLLQQKPLEKVGGETPHLFQWALR
jgi:hypothetical protein